MKTALRTMQLLRGLALALTVVAPLASCAAAESRTERLSQTRIDALLEKADLRDPWKVEQELDRGDEEIPWVVFVTQKPRPLSGDACVAGEVVMRVSADGQTIADREDSSSVAFLPCAEATIDDFHTVDVVGDVNLAAIPLLARLLREVSACSGSNCIHRGAITYESDAARMAFNQLNLSELHRVYVARVGHVSFGFFSKVLDPETLTCRFEKAASGVWNLRVYRDVGPEPAYVN